MALSGRLVGGKFRGINLGSRFVLLLSAVEFEDAVDVDLGDPMLDGCGRFLRAVLFLVFGVTQLTLDLFRPSRRDRAPVIPGPRPVGDSNPAKN